MNTINLSKTQKLVFSSIMMCLYIVIMYFTQSFSFGAYQIRIATSIYALPYLFPFLVLPLGLANFLANTLFGGLGIFDMVGGFIVGIVTSYLVLLIRKKGINKWFVTIPITLIPGLGASIWLSYLLKVPYSVLAVSLCIGQIVPAIVGVLLIKILISRRIVK